MRTLSWIFVLILFASGCAQAGDILLVLSRMNPQFQLSLEGFTAETGHTYYVMNMQDDIATETEVFQNIRKIKPDAVVVFGLEALYTFKDKPLASPLVYTLVDKKRNFVEQDASAVILHGALEQRIALLHQVLPRARRIGIIYNPRFSAKQVSRARQVFAGQAMDVVAIAVEDGHEACAALKKFPQGAVDALWSVYDNTTYQPMVVDAMIEHGKKAKIPFFALSVFHAEAGAFAAFETDYRGIGRQTARLTDAVMKNPSLRGTVQLPQHCIVYVNAQTQDLLNISTIPHLPEIEYVRAGRSEAGRSVSVVRR